MKARIEYFLARLVISFLRLFPLHIAVEIGAFLGGLCHDFDKKHQRVALDNLRTSFGESKDEDELKKIVLRIYQNLGRSYVETLILPVMKSSRIRELTDIEGMKYYVQAKEQGKGVILLSAHFGSWEWLGTVLPICGAVMHAIARPIDNPYLNRLVQVWRSQYGNIILDKRTETGRIIKLLRQGATLGFILDENIELKKAVFVDYFGRPAATNKALATIAIRTGAPVIPLFIIRKKGRHKVVFEKPLILPRTGVLKEDIFAITAIFTRKIEDYVRQYPDQWLWIKRRWKTRPPA